MSTQALLNGYFTYNSTDLSSFVESVTVTVDGVTLDVSTINSTWVKNKLGRKSFTINVTFLDDVADNSVDEVLWTAFSTGTNVTATFKADAGSTSTSNPLYSGSVVPMFGGIGGAGGDILKKTVSFPGDGTLTRATS